MTDITWDHGAWGYNVRIVTRESEISLSSDRPVTSLDVEINEGQSMTDNPRAWEQPDLTASERQAYDAGYRYYWSPTIVKIHVYFEDEGNLHAMYHIDASGRVHTVNRMGKGTANHAKGVGKGITRVP